MGLGRRPRVLVELDCGLPVEHSGGPWVAIEGLVRSLASRFDFVFADRNRVAAADMTMGGAWSAPVSEDRGRESRADRGWLIDRVGADVEPDVIYLNSLFSSFTAARMLGRGHSAGTEVPLVVAPRGQLDPGALRFKRVKKQAFLRMAAATRWWKGVRWHATSALEAEHIAAWAGPDAEIVIAPNLNSVASAARPRLSAGGGPLRMVFLARISPKKNLAYALEVLGAVGEEVAFDVIGPVPDRRYWQACRAQARELPDNVDVRFLGTVPHAEVVDVLARYDMHFQPTMGENWGHAIVEGLAGGTPALISDRTPWSDLEPRQAGWALPLEHADSFRAIIERHARRSPDERDDWRRGAASYAASVLRSADEEYVRLFAPR